MSGGEKSCFGKYAGETFWSEKSGTKGPDQKTQEAKHPGPKSQGAKRPFPEGPWAKRHGPKSPGAKRPGPKSTGSETSWSLKSRDEMS